MQRLPGSIAIECCLGECDTPLDITAGCLPSKSSADNDNMDGVLIGGVLGGIAVAILIGGIVDHVAQVRSRSQSVVKMINDTPPNKTLLL